MARTLYQYLPAQAGRAPELPPTVSGKPDKQIIREVLTAWALR